MFHISREALQRASWPHERDVIDSTPCDYDTIFDELGQYTIDHPLWKEKLSKLESQLQNKSGNIDDGAIPEWLYVIEKFVTIECFADEDAFIHSFKQKLEESYVSNDPYFYPFITSACNAIGNVYKDYNHLFSLNDTFQPLDEVAHFYISRMQEAARYVLHILYSETALPYSEWCSTFSTDDWNECPWKRILDEYPVLIRWLNTIHNNTSAAIGELFMRLDADWEEIKEFFSLSDTATTVTRIELGLSDPHKKGRTVAICHFEGDVKIVYKPKPLSIDAALNKTLIQNSTELGLCPIKVLDKGEYGWVEHIYNDNQDNFKNPASIGRASAALWLLNATDLHVENVLCKDAGVYTLDQETILTPLKKTSYQDPDPAWRTHNIYSTLLFGFSFGEDSTDQISGFLPGEKINDFGPSMEFNLHDNHVHFKEHLEHASNVDKQAQAIYTSNDLNNIAQSFTNLFHSEHHLIIKDFLQNLTSPCTIRIVIRDTYFYGRVLERMRQPKFLRDAALMYADLMSLYAGLFNSEDSDYDIFSVVDCEIEQLLDGDIPYFYTYSNSLDLYTADQKQEGYFTKTGIETALDKITQMEASDVEEQDALIRLSVGRDLIHSYRTSSQERFEDKAQEFLNKHLDYLYETSFCPSNSPSRWMSISGDTSGTEGKAMIGQRDFFAGSWGIFFTFETLSHVTGNKKYQAFLSSQAVLWDLWYERYLKLNSDHNQAFGFSGIGGAIFAQANLLSLNHERWSFLERHMIKLLSNLEDSINSDKALDVIGGSAGLIIGLEQAINCTNNPELTSALKRVQLSAARHLLTCVEQDNKGLSWVTPEETESTLSYAHGWSGISVALCSVLKHLSPQHDLYSAIETVIQQSLSYVLSQYEQHGAWLDYRKRTPEGSLLNNSWCNGKPGLIRGLAAVETYNPDVISSLKQSLIQDVTNALRGDGEFRFCCGQMGIVDLLIDLPSTQKDHDTAMLIESRIDNFLSVIGAPDYEIAPELSFPSLFQGSSGIAYIIARYLSPELPSLSGQWRR